MLKGRKKRWREEHRANAEGPQGKNMHEPNIQVNLDTEPTPATPLTSTEAHQYRGWEQRGTDASPKRGMESKLQRLSISTVIMFSKPQIRTGLENQGHRIAGNIWKTLENRVMGFGLCTDVLLKECDWGPERIHGAKDAESSEQNNWKKIPVLSSSSQRTSSDTTW